MASKMIRGLFASLSAKRKMAFVRRVCLYCLEGKLVTQMRMWMDDNDDAFEGDTSEAEHKLEYTHIHRKFCDAFEDKIETFIQKQGYRPKDFYDYLKIFAEEDPSGFSAQLDVFFSAFDYATFVDLMRSVEKRKYWMKILKIADIIIMTSSKREESEKMEEILRLHARRIFSDRSQLEADAVAKFVLDASEGKEGDRKKLREDQEFRAESLKGASAYLLKVAKEDPRDVRKKVVDVLTSKFMPQIKVLLYGMRKKRVEDGTLDEEDVTEAFRTLCDEKYLIRQQLRTSKDPALSFCKKVRSRAKRMEIEGQFAPFLKKEGLNPRDKKDRKDQNEIAGIANGQRFCDNKVDPKDGVDSERIELGVDSERIERGVDSERVERGVDTLDIRKWRH
eukprot:g2727.t1